MTIGLPPRTSDYEPTFACWKCEDSGFLAFTCPATHCERHQEHPPHAFVARCPCWLKKNADGLRASKALAIQKNWRIPHDCDVLDQWERGEYRYAR